MSLEHPHFEKKPKNTQSREDVSNPSRRSFLVGLGAFAAASTDVAYGFDKLTPQDVKDTEEKDAGERNEREQVFNEHPPEAVDGIVTNKRIESPPDAAYWKFMQYKYGANLKPPHYFVSVTVSGVSHELEIGKDRYDSLSVNQTVKLRQTKLDGPLELDGTP